MRDAAVIRAEALGKRYGPKVVLHDISFELPRGGALVVTGPNGAGKTTLLRLLVGLAAPTRGALLVEFDRSRVGFVGHESLVYRDLTAIENLDLYGRLYRVPERRERIGMLLERFGLWDARRQRVGSFSRGMTQRLALCRALLHQPEFLVLDEPHSALDAQGAELLDDELSSSAGERTLVVATHDPARMAGIATSTLGLERP
jgi:ABC-type multidrug transport system ATPase subunit